MLSSQKLVVKTFLIAFIPVLILLAGCASSGMAPPDTNSSVTVPEDEDQFSPYDPGKMPKVEYRIRRGDGLSIRFLYNSELNVSNIQVRDDGMITVPVIGDILALNRTPSELTGDIREAFGTFIEKTGHGTTLKSGDILQVRFTYSPQLNQRVVVRPDGKVSLLKLGELQADGVGFSQFEKTVLEGYKQFIRDPEMSIFSAKHP
jgi:protein involved in polysaccharide export with SLBB domain